MQRQEAKKPPERPLFTAETRNAQNRQQDPRRNGLLLIDDGFYRSGRLDGGRDRDRTCDPYHVNEAAKAKIALQSVTYGRVHGRTSVDHSRNGPCATRKSRANSPTWREHYLLAVQRDDGLWAIGWHDDAAGPFESRLFAESVAIREVRHARTT
jgi:hypothetical protein